VDERDTGALAALAVQGVHGVATDTMMVDRATEITLARAVLSAARR